MPEKPLPEISGFKDIKLRSIPESGEGIITAKNQELQTKAIPSSCVNKGGNNIPSL